MHILPALHVHVKQSTRRLAPGIRQVVLRPALDTSWPQVRLNRKSPNRRHLGSGQQLCTCGGSERWEPAQLGLSTSNRLGRAFARPRRSGQGDSRILFTFRSGWGAGAPAQRAHSLLVHKVTYFCDSCGPFRLHMCAALDLHVIIRAHAPRVMEHASTRLSHVPTHVGAPPWTCATAGKRARNVTIGRLSRAGLRRRCNLILICPSCSPCCPPRA